MLVALLFYVASFDEQFRAGLMALNKGDLSAAELNLNAAAELQPKNPRVWVALAQTERKLHKDKQAADAAQRAATLANGDSVVLQSLGIYYFEVAQPLLQRQSFGEAAGVLESAVKSGISSPQLQLALGVAYYGLRRFPEAGSAFRRHYQSGSGTGAAVRFPRQDAGSGSADAAGVDAKVYCVRESTSRESGRLFSSRKGTECSIDGACDCTKSARKIDCARR